MSTTATSTDTPQWSTAEKKELLNAVVELGGRKKIKSYKAVESSLKWENIKVDGKTADECKSMYHSLVSKVRKYRTMQEIIDDAVVLIDGPKKHNASEYPDMPKKPLTAFSLFVKKRSKKFPDVKGTQKMKVFAGDWNELSEEKKESYKKKYLKQKKKYEEELEIFRHNHPDCPLPGVNSNSKPNPPLPSKLFIESRIEKLKRKQPELNNTEAVKILVNKYKELSDKKKLKWIKKAMSSRQTYQDQVGVYLSYYPKSTTKPALLHLSKDEERIWHSFKGKPVPAPPKNVFNYFCTVKRDTVHQLSISEQSRKLAALYHKLTEEEVKELTDTFKKEVKEYVQAYTLYYNSLPEEEKSDEKAPEEALAVYNKILEEDKKKKKKKKKSKSSTADHAKKRKLSDVLPRPNGDADVESDDTLPSSGRVAKVKTEPDINPVTPKKRKHSAISDTPVVPAQDEELDEDNLLSMWSPAQPLQITESIAQDVAETPTKSKTPKKTRKSKT